MHRFHLLPRPPPPARGVRGVQRLDHDALVPGGQRLLEQRRGLVGRRAQHARHPVRTGRPLQRLQPRATAARRSGRRRRGAGSRRRTGGAAARGVSAPNRLAVSWNGRGRPSSCSARVSPSSTTRRHGSAAHQLHQLGHAVGHLAQRARPHPDHVAVAVHLDARAVQLVLDADLGARARRARRRGSRRGSPASAGPGGRPRGATASNAAAPPVRASRAVSGRRPDRKNARRTVAAGISAAAATASSITPSSAPWRSSPVNSRCRNCCSSAVAAPNRASSCAGPAGRRARARGGRQRVQPRLDVRDLQARCGRRRHAEGRQRAPARTEPALPRLARQPGGGRLDLAGRRGAKQRGQRRGLRGAGAGGPDLGGAGDDLGEQHAGIEAAPTDRLRLSRGGRRGPGPCRAGPPCARPLRQAGPGAASTVTSPASVATTSRVTGAEEGPGRRPCPARPGPRSRR